MSGHLSAPQAIFLGFALKLSENLKKIVLKHGNISIFFAWGAVPLFKHYIIYNMAKKDPPTVLATLRATPSAGTTRFFLAKNMFF